MEQIMPYSPALPSPDSAFPSPISTIPPEILGRILDHTFKSSLSKGCRVNMSNAALVSTAWRDPALERLWRRLNIRTFEKVLSIAATPRKRAYATRSLELVIGDRDVGLLERLLGRLSGLEELVIRGGYCPAGLAPFFLESAPLKNLTVLHLTYMSNLFFNITTFEALPSQLHTLSLGNGFECAPLLTGLLAASSTTLKTLLLQECIDIFHGIGTHPRLPHDVPHLPLLKSANLSVGTWPFVGPFRPGSLPLRKVYLNTNRGEHFRNQDVVDWLEALSSEGLRADGLPLHCTEELVIVNFSSGDHLRQSKAVRGAVVKLLQSKHFVKLDTLTLSSTRKELDRTPGARELFRHLNKATPPIKVTYGHLRHLRDPEPSESEDDSDSEEGSDSDESEAEEEDSELEEEDSDGASGAGSDVSIDSGIEIITAIPAV